MTQIHKIVALGAAVVGLALSQTGRAQDDLDDLLKDLESDTDAKVEVAAKTDEKPVAEAEEEPAEEPATEEPVVAATEAETVAETPTEEPVVTPAEEPVVAATEEETVAETPAEEPVVTAAEEPAEETPVATVAETPQAETPAVSEEAELIENIVQTERIRRKALDTQALRQIDEARKCMKNREYDDAIHYYENALKLLEGRAAMKNFTKECTEGIAQGLYKSALLDWDLGLTKKAVEKMTQAREWRHPRASGVLEKWRDKDQAVAEGKASGEDLNPKHGDEYKADREQIRKHLRRSAQYLALRDLTKALEECEIVLVNDPHNEQAIRIRKAIQKKRSFILEKEREAAREGMIADVNKAWRPAYAIDAAQLNKQAVEMVKAQTGDDPERTKEQDIERRMKEMKLPNISFKPPATIIDAVEFFRQASRDYDRPDIPVEKRGFNFVLRTPAGAIKQQAPSEDTDDFTASTEEDVNATSNGLEPISTITASDITFHEALKLVCDSVGYKFIVRGQVVMVMPMGMSTAELIARKYNVPEAFVERVSNASDEMKQMGGFGSNNSNRNSQKDEDEGEGQDWKAFFQEMGVEWPEGSSIKHIKSLGKLYVRNTRENLAEFEKVLDELGGQPQLIEIETRFVEVSQEDLNSLGFEWLLNSDYTLNLGDKLGKALGVKKTAWGSVSDSSREWTSTRDVTTASSVTGSNGATIPGLDHGATSFAQNGTGRDYSKTLNQYSNGGRLIQDGSGARGLGINAMGGDSDFGMNNRYLSSVGNHISGESKSTNDQFMRVNAFLGNADLSMILHMLSQRSDTDLLSAPKVVTKSGENAVIKVVTEFIYPQDYDVQLQSSSSSSSGSGSGGSQSAILAVVEPQNFTMREVGVILDVTPTYSEANGGTIDLELKPQVVDEPTWKNYGMKIPFTGNASNSSLEFNPGAGPFPDHPPSEDVITGITTRYWDAVANLLDNLAGGGNNNITYYDAPMEQPFFHVRSIDSKVSITPGATVVMGGLITEQRKSMDDKVPFLGDLPFIGRLFRSHAEQTIKRNLLIFVTGRLITPSGRELKLNEERESEADVKAAPQAE